MQGAGIIQTEYGKDKKLKTDLIESIAEAFGIYISDLKQEQIRMQTLAYILECSGYEITEWNKLINYIFGLKCEFNDEKEAKDFYIKQICSNLNSAGGSAGRKDLPA